MGNETKGVALNYGAKHIHYNDHLAPICSIMGIPLILMEEEDYLTCKRCYPGITIELADYKTFGPDFLASNFDVLFMSDLFDRDLFHLQFGPFEEKYNKRLRHVHCPHGFSDKGFYLKKAAREDIALVYGQNMLDLFKFCGVSERLHRYVVTGNIRYTYYKMHKAHFDAIAEAEVFSLFDKKQPTILYAPTWLDYEQSSSFFDCAEQFLGRLPAGYNLLVKLHPRLELDDTRNYYRILGQYEKQPNIVFINDFPVIYPLLERSDLYIGDMSSIGYDYLIYNRPMFFLNKRGANPSTDHRLFLYRCGIDIKPMELPALFSIIEKNLADDSIRFGEVRNEVYTYTFGDEKRFTTIKEEIVAAYSEKPSYIS